MPFLYNFLIMNFKKESLIGEFPNIGKFPTLLSPDKSGKNSLALLTNSEIFQGEPLHGEFIENVWLTPTDMLPPLIMLNIFAQLFEKRAEDFTHFKKLLEKLQCCAVTFVRIKDIKAVWNFPRPQFFDVANRIV